MYSFVAYIGELTVRGLPRKT